MRKILFPLSLILGLLILGCGSNAIFAKTALFRGNLARTGVYEAKGVPVFHQVKWQFKTGGAVRSSITIAGRTAYFGSEDTYLYALDTTHGKLKWKFKTGGGISSTPAVSGDIVYFLSSDGNLYAVNAKTGQKRWSFKTPAELIRDRTNFLQSSPIIGEGLVFFGGYDSCLYALDQKTGKQKWYFRTFYLENRSLLIDAPLHSSPALSGGVIYFGSFTGDVFALTAKTGRLIWRRKTKDSFQAPPVILEKTVFICGNSGYLYAIEAVGGKVKWVSQFSELWVPASLAAWKDTLYLAYSNGLQARNTGSGLKKWELNTPVKIFTSPSIAADIIYVAESTGFPTKYNSGEGCLYAIALKTGQVKWRFPSIANIYSSPVVSDDVLYFGSDAGYVYALR